MTRNKRPPTATESRIIGTVERLVLCGDSLNRACYRSGISAATYYRLGGKTRGQIAEMSEARTGHAVAAK